MAKKRSGRGAAAARASVAASASWRVGRGRKMGVGGHGGAPARCRYRPSDRGRRVAAQPGPPPVPRTAARRRRASDRRPSRAASAPPLILAPAATAHRARPRPGSTRTPRSPAAWPTRAARESRRRRRPPGRRPRPALWRWAAARGAARSPWPRLEERRARRRAVGSARRGRPVCPHSARASPRMAPSMKPPPPSTSSPAAPGTPERAAPLRADARVASPFDALPDDLLRSIFARTGLLDAAITVRAVCKRWRAAAEPPAAAARGLATAVVLASEPRLIDRVRSGGGWTD